VICGYGRIGSELARSLETRGIRYSVVDINPATIRHLRSQGAWAAYGDATEEHVLNTLGINRARTIAITIPDLVGTRGIIRLVREINPGIAVIARAYNAAQVEPIANEGANEVVQPEFEAAMEFTRQVLTWQGVDDDVAIADILRRRAEVYRLDEELVRPEPGVRIESVEDQVTLVG
jgi:CPA2 family monovalent cation:H+ antiporter-2